MSNTKFRRSLIEMLPMPITAVLLLIADQTIIGRIGNGLSALGFGNAEVHTIEVQRRERRVLLKRSRQRLGPLIADLTACTPKRPNKERDAHRPMPGTGLDSPLPIHELLPLNRGAHGGGMRSQR